MSFTFLSRALQVGKCLKFKKVIDSFIPTHCRCKITKSVYRHCHRIVILKKRGHSLMPFALKGSQLTMYSLVIEPI